MIWPSLAEIRPKLDRIFFLFKILRAPDLGRQWPDPTFGYGTSLIKTMLKLSYLRKIANSAIDINLELNDLENMSVRVACCIFGKLLKRNCNFP